MNDDRVWAFEESLWTGDAENYKKLIDDECLMVLPEPPYVMSGKQAVEAVAETPRWSKVKMTQKQVARPEEGLIVIAYKADAEKQGGKGYEAWCTSTLRRLSHDEWRVVQHQQLPPLAATA